MGDNQRIDPERTSLSQMVCSSGGDNVTSTTNSKYLLEYEELSQQIHNQNVVVDEMKSKLRVGNCDGDKKTVCDNGGNGGGLAVRKAMSSTGPSLAEPVSYLSASNAKNRTHSSMTNIGVGESLVVDLAQSAGEDEYDEDDDDDGDDEDDAYEESEAYSYDEEDGGQEYEGENNMENEINQCEEVILNHGKTIDGLNQKYVVLNFELNSVQKTDGHFVSQEDAENYFTDSNDKNTCSASTTKLKDSGNKNNSNGNANSNNNGQHSASDSEYSLDRKYTQIFQTHSVADGVNQDLRLSASAEVTSSHNSANKMPTASQNLNRQRSVAKMSRTDNKENIAPKPIYRQKSSVNLKSIIQILKNVIEIQTGDVQFNSSQSHTNTTTTNNNCSGNGNANNNCNGNGKNQLDIDLKELQRIITALLQEQEEFRKVIQEQQRHLNEYHCKYVKAQKIIQKQKFDISKLHASNSKLENEINTNMNTLKMKFESKLQEVGHLPKMIKEEKTKNEKYSKDNSALMGRVRTLQSDISQLKTKLDEATRRKTASICRFKATEKDLKIFKNQNNILKQEKAKLAEELTKLRTCLEGIQTANNKNNTRQRERVESHNRDLQKRIHDLETELTESRASTSILLQERDKMIAEMQTQLNTLVHNFEVSQKYVRVLRRHIYTAGSSNSCSSGNLADKSTR